MAKTCKKKNKKAFGGMVKNDHLTDYLRLAQERSFAPNQIPHPNQAIAENQLAMSRADLASNTKLTQGLDIAAAILGTAGSTISKMKFNYGGKVPKTNVEVEGEEILHTPQGDILEVLGAKHEQGGVDLNLPIGTEVFSDRIKIDDETLANRKKKRTKKQTTLTKMLKDFEHDTLLENSLNRTKTVHSKQEAQDKQVQELVNLLKKSKEKKYKFGTPPGGIPEEEEDNTPNFLHDGNYIIPLGAGKNMSGYYSLEEQKDMGLYPEKNTKDSSTNEDIDFLSQLLKNAPTLGDAMGVGGNLFQAFAPAKITKQARATDTPNINYFKDFGKEGLKTLDKTKDYVSQIRNTKMNELNLASNTNTARNRNTARGVNTMRALDLAGNAQSNIARNQIEDAFANAMMSIYGQEAGMQNTIDQMVMGGEQARDIADRQDKGAYFSQRARDLVAMGEGISRTGKHSNEMKTNEAMLKLINQISPYFDVDKSGNITVKEGVDFRNEYAKHVNPKTKKPFTQAEWSKLTKEEREKYLKEN